ncbi:MAG TPA: HlyD family secretion protein [Usitatibacter sp.]|nr:HlyD family secretion protein [Usitatibacter sp.]
MSAGEGARPGIASQIRSRTLPRGSRRVLMILGPVVVVAAALYFYLTGGRYETTDDAYVETARVAISCNVAGRVEEVAVRENQPVRKGDLLFRLDEAPFRIAVEDAAAQLAAARLRVESLKASYRQRLSEQRAAEDTLAYQQREYERQKRLLPSGISSQLQVDRALHAVQDAEAQLAGAKQRIGEVVASLGGDPRIAPERHPAVQQAQAALDRARLELSYTVVRAPADGIVARVDRLQPGTYIAAAAPVFALVSATDVWVEANFKEDQLEHMRAGQAATVEVDAYPGHTFRATVASLSPGTGSQFSALPAENATGNWVKVVQRVPVRLHLDRLDPAYPLHAGLSASATVDTRHRRRLLGSAGAGEAGPQAARS